MPRISRSDYLDAIIRNADRHLRKRRRTWYWLGQQSGVSTMVISHLRNGKKKTLTIDTGAALAHALGLTLSELMEDEP